MKGDNGAKVKDGINRWTLPMGKGMWLAQPHGFHPLAPVDFCIVMEENSCVESPLEVPAGGGKDLKWWPQGLPSSAESAPQLRGLMVIDHIIPRTVISLISAEYGAMSGTLPELSFRDCHSSCAWSAACCSGSVWLEHVIHTILDMKHTWSIIPALNCRGEHPVAWQSENLNAGHLVSGPSCLLPLDVSYKYKHNTHTRAY